MNLWISLFAILFQVSAIDAYKNECDNHLCKHGGKCVALKPSGYKCDCSTGYAGRYCEKASSPPYTKCVRTYEKLGCYNSVSEPLTQLLISDRKQSSPYRLIWKKWGDSMHSLACRCADAARKNNFKVFGLQNYGECWSGPGAETSYEHDGPSDKCLLLLKFPPACDMKDPRECMGVPYVNFMYRLDEDECVNSPCKNGGSCVNTVGSFRCKCAQQFQGNLCEQDVDECTRHPCHNGATCLNTVGGFQCKCSAGFKGNLCELDEDECIKSPCQNGASCVNTPGSFKCNCREGFKGDLCEQDEDECVKSPCKNGASCVNTQGSFRCNCREGFKGDLCEQVVDACQSSPCLHGGSCDTQGNGFKCNCVKGFIGMRCDQDFDECVRRPCSNGASCVNTMGSFKCICRAGFTDKLCDQDIDECTPLNPCKNGAPCINQNGGFRCVCPAGISGMLCDLDVNECRTQVCLNGGTCVNTQGSFYCRCRNGYSGKNCEEGGCIKNGKYDLGIIMDGSGSVGNLGFVDTKLFLLGLIFKFNVSPYGTHFGIIMYSSEPHLVCRFSNPWYHSSANLRWKILGLQFPDGDTRTDQALRMAGTDLYSTSGGDREEVPNVLVVITDGNTAQGSEPYKDVLKPLKDHQVNIIAVGVGDDVSRAELSEIAMGRNERVIQVNKIGELPAEILKQMIDDIC